MVSITWPLLSASNSGSVKSSSKENYEEKEMIVRKDKAMAIFPTKD